MKTLVHGVEKEPADRMIIACDHELNEIKAANRQVASRWCLPPKPRSAAIGAGPGHWAHCAGSRVIAAPSP